MKIISIIVPNLSGGGAQRNAINLANYWSSNGFEVHLVIFRNIIEFKIEINKKVKIINFKVERSRFVLFKLRKYLKENNISLVISMMRDSSIAIVLASFFLKKKFVLFSREANHYDYLKELSFFKNFYMFLIMRLVYVFPDLIIANSFQTLISIKKFTKLNLKNSTVIYNPVIKEGFYSLKIKKANHKWIKSDEFKVILGVGRLHIQKDFQNLIKAFYLLQKDYTNLRLIILGEGNEREKLISLINLLGIKNKIHLKGFVNNPFEYMRGADLFCLSSKYEGFGNVIVEAMSVGTKVVVTNCPGGPLEIIENGKFGGIANVNDHKSLAKAISKELIYKRDTQTLINKSKDFSVVNFVKKIEDEFNKK